MAKSPFKKSRKDNQEEEENTCTLTPNEILLSMFNIPLSSTESVSTAPNIIEDQLIDNNITFKNEDFGFLDDLSMSKTDVSNPPLLRRHGLFNNYISVNKACSTPRSLSSNIPLKQPERRFEPSVNINTTLSSINPSLADALSSLQAKSPTINTRNMPFLSNSRSTAPRIAKERPPIQLTRQNELNRINRISIPGDKCTSALTGRQALNTGPELSQTVSHVVFNGQATEVPDEILCHLCQFPMKICYRKSKYKSEIREYPAYRCLRKGCQTFRAIRKVIDPSQVSRVSANRKRKTDVAPPDEFLSPFLKEFLSTSEKTALPTSPEPIQDQDAPKQTLGTLIYVPAVMTQAQILKVQEAAMKVVLDSVGVVVAPMVVPSPYKYDQIRENLESDDGVKMIQKLFMESAANGPPVSFSSMNLPDADASVKPCISPSTSSPVYSSPVPIQQNQNLDVDSSENCIPPLFTTMFSECNALQYGNEQPIDMELNFDNFDEFDTQ